MSLTAIAADLFACTPQLRLIGGRHRESRRIVFPLPADDAYQALELPHHGVLWSYTVQRFAPKSPPYRSSLPFVPFAVGYIELPAALIVESLLVEVDFAALRVGLPMELTTVELPRGASGDRVHTYAFRPRPEPAA